MEKSLDIHDEVSSPSSSFVRSTSEDRSRSRSRERGSKRIRSKTLSRRSRRSRSESIQSRSRSRRRCSRRRSRSFTRSPSYERRIRYYGTRENPFKSRVIGIFGLSAMTNEAKLMEEFEQYGTIQRVSIIHDAKTGNSRGFGFIYFQDTDEATRARTRCNGMMFDGKRIRVDYSITKRAHTPTPGVYMGAPKSSERRSSRRHRSKSRDRRRSRSRRNRRRHDYSDHEYSRYSRSRSR